MSPSYYYVLLDHCVQTNRPFSYLDTVKKQDRHLTARIQFFDDGIDSIIDADCLLLYQSLRQRSDQLPLFSVYEKSDYLIVNYPQIITFLIKQNDFDVEVYIENLSWDKVEMILFGTILSIVCELNGILCFHASALSYKNRAFMLIGQSGVGKTTLTTALALQEDFELLADDIVAVKQENYTANILPTYKQIRLWPDSVQALFNDVEKFPTAYFGTDKRVLILNQNQTKLQFDLDRIYFLNSNSTKQTPSSNMQSVSAKEALLGLIRYSYAGRLVGKIGIQPRRLQLLTSMVEVIRSADLLYPRQYEILPEVIRLVRNDLNQLD